MIRRNELEKISNLPPQTLGNHINHLIKLNIVKDKKNGNYNRGFYVDLEEESQLVPDSEAQLIKDQVEKMNEYYDSWTPEKAITGLIWLSYLLELKMTQIWLKKQLPNANQEKLEMQEQVIWTFNKTHRDFLRKSLMEKTLAKQEELIYQLNQRIAKLQDSIFGQLTS